MNDEGENDAKTIKREATGEAVGSVLLLVVWWR